MSEDRLAFGLHIRSDLALPELLPAPAGSERPRVRIRLDRVETSIPGGTPFGRMIQVAPDDFLLDLPRVARYRVRNGNEIVVEPAPGAAIADVRLYLLGSALGVICYQRGLQPLHANAIVVDGQCIAFAGPSGVGKSTLAAFLAKRGYRVLADDVCVLSIEADGRVLAWPGVAQFKLWKDTLSELGHDPTGLERVMGDREKYHLPNERTGDGTPAPIRRLYVLQKAQEGQSAGIRRLAGAAALKAFVANVYRPRLLAPLGKQVAAYSYGIATLKQAEVFSLRRRWSFDLFTQDMDMLERHLRDTAA